MIRRGLLLLAVLIAQHAHSQSFWRRMPNTPNNAGAFYNLFFDRRGDAFLSFRNVGPYRSVNYGGLWVPAATGLPQNDVANFTSPATDLHLAGLLRGQFPTAGIFRSTNAGTNWTASGLNTRSVLHVEWYTGQTVFAIADGLTLFRSTNNGATWDSVLAGGGVRGGNLIAFVANRINGSLFAVSSIRGVFRSTNNGSTWVPANSGLLDSIAVQAIAVDSAGVVYAALGFPSNFPGLLYRSTNNGTSWSSVGNIGFGPKEIFLNSLGHLFALAGEYGIRRSTDGGRSWVALHAGFNDSIFVSRGTVSPGGYVYIGTVTGLLYRSELPTAPPIIPTHLAPANGSMLQNEVVQFIWTRYEGGAVHHLQIATSPSFTQTSLVFNDSTLGSNITSGITLPRTQLLYWRVRVQNSVGWGNFSQAWTVGVQPAALALLAPADSALDQPLTPTLSWQNLGSSITYHLQVSTSSMFSSFVVNDSTLTATQRTVGPLAPFTTYYWRVRAANSPTGSGPFSSARRFRTVGVPSITLEPRTISFRQVPLGSVFNRTVRAINFGTATLVIDSVRVRGTRAREFSIAGVPEPSPPIRPGDTLVLAAVFVPETLGVKSAFALVFSNAPTSPDTITMSGEGIPSPIQVVIPTPRIGDSLRARVTIPPTFPLASASLYYREGGSLRGYQVTRLNRQTDTLSAVIPRAYVTIRGIDYYVLVFDSSGSMLSFPAGNYVQNPAHIRVPVESVLFPDTLQAARYKMISIPLEIAQPDFNSVLADDFGPYDRTQWRILRWNGSAYSEFQNIIPPSFQKGVAFWLITRSGGRFDIVNALSISARQTINVPVQPGWNQIGNPFAFPVDWVSVGNSQLVRGPFFYDGVQFVPDVGVLSPWQGYFVYNDSSDTISLTIPPVESKSRAMRWPTSTSSASGAYRLQLSASSGSLSDAYNFIGFRDGAVEGDDKTDLPKPPAVGEGVRLSVMQDGRDYACNYKPLAGDGAEWTVHLSSPASHRTVNVTLHEEGVPPIGFGVYVLDEDELAAVPVTNGAFAVRFDGAQRVRTLRVLIGIEAFVNARRDGIPLQPMEFALLQNYPNPFNPSTTIRYTLGKRAKVALDLFDVLGKHVRTLVRAEQGAGAYNVVWDGTDDRGIGAASGVYMLLLRAGDFRATRKILLVR
ncbi:MAG: hypothetical protein C4326_08675 [Ignavibacteria bacterium]